MELLKGEKIEFSHRGKEKEVQMSAEEINQKYIKGEVRIVTEQARYPLQNIVGMIDSNNYALNPEFQRRHRWNEVQKSRLIESFIMNVPIPPIFLYEDRYSHYEVMDGLQRLTAIYEFYTDKVDLSGLEQWPELNGMKYSTLPLQIKKGIDRRYLSSIILLQETAKDEIEAQKLKQLVFERINSGGVQLKPQESRNAVYNGPLNDLCIKLARNKYLCKMWDIPLPTPEEIESKNLSQELVENKSFREMEDVELVLRFFANRQRDTLFRQSENFGDFLDNFLRYGNKMNSETLIELERLFTDTVEFVYNLFKEKAFWLYRNRFNKWGWLERPVTIVYDTLMYVASNHLENKSNILSKSDDIESRIETFYKQNYDTFEGRNVNPSIIVERQNALDRFFLELSK